MHLVKCKSHPGSLDGWLVRGGFRLNLSEPTPLMPALPTTPPPSPVACRGGARGGSSPEYPREVGHPLDRGESKFPPPCAPGDAAATVPSLGWGEWGVSPSRAKITGVHFRDEPKHRLPTQVLQEADDSTWAASPATQPPLLRAAQSGPFFWALQIRR